MFSQPKQSQPTFKFIIRSDLPTDAPSEASDTTTSPSPSTTEHNISSADQPTSTPHSTTLPNIDRKRKRTDKESGPLATKKVHSCLERWGQTQEELQENDVLQQPETRTEPLETDFGDYQLMACLLCNRKFKSAQDIARHQALSDLHKKNSQDPVAIDKAKAKLRNQAAKQSTPTPTPPILDNTSETPNTYRNRAAERRQAYHQPECPDIEIRYNKRPPPNKATQQPNATTSFEGGADLSKPMADNNMGARMLKQMGWKKGQGLGKEGSGIVDPVTAERYAQGAGLGSANAKSRIDSGGSQSYKDRAKELARRRLQDEL